MSNSRWLWRSLHGRWLTLRPVMPADRLRYAAFVARLSYGTRYFRYGRGNPGLSDDDLMRACSLDVSEGRHYVVVAAENDEEVIVGSGGYFRNEDGNTCEMTIVVADAWQGARIAHRLMTTLIEQATADGLMVMDAEILATNLKMLRFALRHGFAVIPGVEMSPIKRLRRRLGNPDQTKNAA